MQVVRYPSLGSTEGSDFIKVTVQILQKIAREKPKERALRRWMRGQGFFDKETFDLLKGFLGIESDAKSDETSLGPFGGALLDTSDLGRRQDLLFEKLAEGNEILVKYVFDALQERLYSTSELFRMLTSYVYPGHEVDLPDFTLWLKWMEATGRVRILGIRWAPGKRFEDSAAYIKSIDVDEILEEEAEEALMGDVDEEGDEAPPVPAKPSPVAASAPEPEEDDDDEPSAGWEPPEDDEVEEQDPTPAALAPVPAAAVGGALSAEALAVALGALSRPAGPSLIEARLLDPAPHLSTLAAGAPLERVREALAAEPRQNQVWIESLEPPEETMAENARTLLEWWGERSDRPGIRSDQFGIMPYGKQGWEEGSRGRFLFRIGCLAISLLRGASAGEVAFSVLDGAGFYGRLYEEPGSVERLLDELFEQGLGARPELFADLHLVLMLARSLRGAESWCEGLSELDTDDLLAALWQRLAAYQLHEEVLWIAREMSLFGLWRQEGLRLLQVVPTAEARRMAFHLGFVESARVSGLPGLIALSRRLTPLMGAQLEGPLVGLWRAYGARPPERFWTR